MPRASPRARWRTGIRRRTISAREVLRRHPWAPALMNLRPGYDYGKEFEFGLDLVLDGLERALDG